MFRLLWNISVASISVKIISAAGVTTRYHGITTIGTEVSFTYI